MDFFRFHLLIIIFMKLVASILGIGYLKGGGTYAALLTTIVWYLLTPNIGFQILAAIIFFILSIWAGNVVEKEWGKDSSKVVIDEVIGMIIALMFLPITWKWSLAAFVLFRFFDIVKPLGIRRLEKYKGGFGVTIDDVAAGLIANIILLTALLLI
jgi:phosphatidylglycerophosphatase A